MCLKNSLQAEVEMPYATENMLKSYTPPKLSQTYGTNTIWKGTVENQF